MTWPPVDHEDVEDEIELLRFSGVIGAGIPIVLVKVAGVWPGVPTTRTDIPIFWKGPDPSPPQTATVRTLGVAEMLNNVDMRLITP